MELKVLSDGKKDGIALTYVKDGVLYPVGLTKEQVERLEIMLGVVLENKLSVIINKPLGNVTSLIEGGE